MEQNPLHHILEYNLDIGENEARHGPSRRIVLPLLRRRTFEKHHGHQRPYDLAGKRLPLS